jgi:hypothetical protein
MIAFVCVTFIISSSLVEISFAWHTVLGSGYAPDKTRVNSKDYALWWLEKTRLNQRTYAERRGFDYVWLDSLTSNMPAIFYLKMSFFERILGLNTDANDSTGHFDRLLNNRRTPFDLIMWNDADSVFSNTSVRLLNIVKRCAAAGLSIIAARECEWQRPFTKRIMSGNMLLLPNANPNRVRDFVTDWRRTTLRLVNMGEFNADQTAFDQLVNNNGPYANMLCEQEDDLFMTYDISCFRRSKDKALILHFVSYNKQDRIRTWFQERSSPQE